MDPKRVKASVEENLAQLREIDWLLAQKGEENLPPDKAGGEHKAQKVLLLCPNIDEEQSLDHQTQEKALDISPRGGL